FEIPGFHLELSGLLQAGPAKPGADQPDKMPDLLPAAPAGTEDGAGARNVAEGSCRLDGAAGALVFLRDPQRRRRRCLRDAAGIRETGYSLYGAYTAAAEVV